MRRTLAPPNLPRLLRQAAIVTLALTAPLARAQAQADPADAGMQFHPFGGLRVGVPQHASIAAVLQYPLTDVGEGSSVGQDLLFAIEPGVTAGRVSADYLAAYGRWASGIAVGATALRTWGRPWSAPQHATYVGAEVYLFPAFAIGPRVSLLRGLGDSAESKRWLLALDFGFGF
jgi:hypothetical protein